MATTTVDTSSLVSHRDPQIQQRQDFYNVPTSYLMPSNSLMEFTFSALSENEPTWCFYNEFFGDLS